MTQKYQKELKNKNIKIAKSLPAKIFQREGVVLSYLFGSQATGQAYQESDIDIAVLFKKPLTPRQYFTKGSSLAGELSSFFNNNDVDLVVLNAASPLLRQAAINEGKQIFCGDEDERIRFTVQTLHDYEDYLHLSDIYSRVLKQKI